MDSGGPCFERVNKVEMLFPEICGAVEQVPDVPAGAEFAPEQVWRLDIAESFFDLLADSSAASVGSAKYRYVMASPDQFATKEAGAVLHRFRPAVIIG